MNLQTEKLDKLLKLVKRGISERDFVESFENVLAYVKEIKTDSESELSALREIVNDYMLSNREEMTSEMTTCIEELNHNFDVLRSQLSETIDKKLVTVKNGKDGKDGRDGLDGKDGLDGLAGKDGSPDKPLDIRSKLETLEGEDRLDISAIKGSEQILEDLKKSGKQVRVGWGAHPLVVRDEGTIVNKVTRNIDFVGAGVTVTEGSGTTTVTIPGSVGGSGITRTIVTTSGNTTMGASASTDYVYLVAGAHTMTLPTAVGNTNLYTVKNNHSVAITINTTSSQTIDGTTTISIQTEDSVDIISNGSNWFVV